LEKESQDMNKTFQEQLKEWKKKQHDKKPQKSSIEVLTESDIKSLMGVNRNVYVRGKGGAYRQK